MKEKMFRLISMIAAVVLSSGCVSAVSAAPIKADNTSTPTQVIEDFYRWYLEFSVRDEKGNFENPLADRAYRDSEYLSEASIEEVDSLLDGMETGSYGPFLCAQDIPQEVRISDSFPEEDAIVMIMESSFEGHKFEVELSPANEQYRISGIRCK